jgi:FkbM family methyltransferase
MDRELQFWMSMTRRLPRIKGAGRTASLVQRIYARKPRERIRTPVLGFMMDLDPHECFDGSLLFAPQLSDYRELDILKRLIRPGDVFFDIGAHVGMYTLVVSQLVGEAGKVVAIEANTTNYSWLRLHCELNHTRNVKCIQVGVSDRTEKLRMACSFYGNRSGNSFLKESPTGEWIECRPLLEVVKAETCGKIDGAKLDIEGFEFRVLSAFFSDAPTELHPRFMIFEHNRDLLKKSGGDARKLLKDRGYSVQLIADQNYLAEKEC